MYEGPRQRSLLLPCSFCVDKSLHAWQAIRILKDAGSIEYSQAYAQRLLAEAWEGVDEILKESQAKRNLKLFADYLIDREL